MKWLMSWKCGSVIIPVHNQSTLLSQFFKKYDHFHFSKEELGIVYCKELVTSLKCKKYFTVFGTSPYN